MNLRKISLLTVLISIFSIEGFSQSFLKDNGITPGLRIGSNYSTWYGVSGRMSFDSGSFEMILTPANNRLTLTGLVEVHESLSVDGLSYFYGIGAHAGFESNAVPIIGADAIAGLEYEISGSPFMVSLDFKPALDLISSNIGLHWNQGALTVRYALGK